MLYAPVNYQKTNLPILADSDLLITGGSFGGIACALEAARAGLQVTMIEPRTFLGREVTATLRPWFTLSRSERAGTLPDLISGAIQAAGTPEHPGGILPLKIGVLKTFLEDQLFSAGVKLLYGSLPVNLFLQDRKLAGLVIGNKSGRQVINAPVIVDTLETNLLAQFAGMHPVTPHEPLALYQRTVEFDHLEGDLPDHLPVPAELGIAGNEIDFIPGAAGAGHGFINCRLLMEQNDQERGGWSAAGWTAREIQARQITMEMVAYLIHQVAAFRHAYLAGASYQLYGPVTGRMERILAPWVHHLGSDDEALLVVNAVNPVSIHDLASPLPGLFILGEGMLADEGLNQSLRDPIGAARTGQAVGGWVARNYRRLNELITQTQSHHQENVDMCMDSTSGSPEPYPVMQIKELLQQQRGSAYHSIPVPQESLPVMRKVDVLVVGGGTSGATAATISARQGAKTLLIELNPGLGGTGTFGGVHSYWFGQRKGYSREVIEAVEKTHAELGMAPPEGALLKWNIEAKMHALLQRAKQAGVEIIWNAIIIGAMVKGNQVCGAVVATPFGPAAVEAEVVIDATGDGDVAVFAGAEYHYGAARDHITMWYSLAQFYRPGVTHNNFASMVNVGNVEDATRAILAGRRRATGHDAGSYIAPRESRHILADVVLTLNDQLLKRCWPDTITIAFSNHDVKGHTSSDWVRAGLIPPNLEVEIPYRAMLPRGLEGILVTGKAISATHDAQPAVRMQPDMENLGGVAGLAAALAVQAACLPRHLDVRELQIRLVSDGVLPEAIVSRALQPRQRDIQKIVSLLLQMDPQKPLYAYQDMELDVVHTEEIPIVALCCIGPQVLPVLEDALRNSQGTMRLMIARVLALVGSKAGVPDLIEAIHAETPDERLQYRSSHIRHANLPPDQGAAPDVVYLLYTLGMARDPLSLPVWEHFADLIAMTGPDDIRDRSLGLFYYVDALCYGAERLGDPRAIPLLKRIHSNSMFQKRTIKTGFEPDYFLERQAYLELVIARALARCGDKTGYEVLADYLDDARALLAEHAHSELVRLTGQDFGKDQQAWREWLEHTKHQRQPRPLTEPNEPVSAWDEEILTCRKGDGTGN